MSSVKVACVSSGRVCSCVECRICLCVKRKSHSCAECWCFLCLKQKSCRVLCVTVACGTIEWVSNVSRVRDTRVSSAKGKLVF